VLDLIPLTLKHSCGQCQLEVHLKRKEPSPTADLKNFCRVDEGLEIEREELQELIELSLCCHIHDLREYRLLLDQSFKIGI